MELTEVFHTQESMRHLTPGSIHGVVHALSFLLIATPLLSETTGDSKNFLVHKFFTKVTWMQFLDVHFYVTKHPEKQNGQAKCLE